MAIEMLQIIICTSRSPYVFIEKEVTRRILRLESHFIHFPLFKVIKCHMGIVRGISVNRKSTWIQIKMIREYDINKCFHGVYTYSIEKT